MPSGGDVETATRIRPGGKDGFGNRSAGSTPDEPVVGLFAPGHTAEHNRAANQVDTLAKFYADHGPDIRPGDQLLVRGQLWNVVGDVADWGTRNGLEINLRKVTG